MSTTTTTTITDPGDDYARMSDGDLAHEITCRIPFGRWTNYGTVAEVIRALTGRQLSGWAVAMRLLRVPYQPTPWHRLRDRDGYFKVPGSERRDHAVVLAEVNGALVAEGCRVDVAGFADPRGFIDGAELLRHMSVARVERVSPERAAEIQARVRKRMAKRR